MPLCIHRGGFHLWVAELSRESTLILGFGIHNPLKSEQCWIVSQAIRKRAAHQVLRDDKICFMTLISEPSE